VTRLAEICMGQLRDLKAMTQAIGPASGAPGTTLTVTAQGPAAKSGILALFGARPPPGPVELNPPGQTIVQAAETTEEPSEIRIEMNKP
jgi:hypothetical protein